MNNEFSPLALAATLGVAIVTTQYLARFFYTPHSTGRFASIDGLRGYLALFVFIHHASIWYGYAHTGAWQLPPAHLYAHLGQSSVALFFMITGFLFHTKIISSESGKIDWIKIASSRLLRIFPLYIAAIAVMLFTVLWASNWELHDPILKVAKNVAQWLTLTLLGAPRINQFEQTGLITAGVTWSLPIEWMFYCCLPLLAFVAGKRPGRTAMIFGIFSALVVLRWRPDAIRCTAFLGGIAAAYAVRRPLLVNLARKPMGTALAVTSALLAIFLFPSGYWPLSLILFGIAFCVVACGNDLFGTLTTRTAKILGEMAYSIYLLHGILLFYVFNFVVKKENFSLLSPAQHWTIVACATPVLLVICAVTFKNIEQPFINRTKKLSMVITKAMEMKFLFQRGQWR